MPLWLTPLLYAMGSIVCGLTLPRIEHMYFPSYTFDVSVASAQAFLSAVASGMMALTGIVFSIAFVVVQFSAIAYSPRLVLWFARDPLLFHSLGVFVATFMYSLSTLVWIDRAGSGNVPLFSSILVIVMIILSTMLFARLVQSINNLQITNVLQIIGDRGRSVIRDLFPRLTKAASDQTAASDVSADTKHTGGKGRLGPVTQTLSYTGVPKAVASINMSSLVKQATSVNAVIVMANAVGDTVVEGTVMLRVHGGKETLPERDLLRAVRLESDRTFEQDPKYPIRLLVDIAIKALSPAINDPTTAVQAISQIEDLLLRLGERELDVGCVDDSCGVLRLICPMPTWEDFLTLAFDEIRQYGAGSVQVMRRLRAALIGLSHSLASVDRVAAVNGYLKHLDLAIEQSPLDAEDRAMARHEDRQGLGLTRRT
jgi:uncharacterized membrane protein